MPSIPQVVYFGTALPAAELEPIAATTLQRQSLYPGPPSGSDEVRVVK